MQETGQLEFHLIIQGMCYVYCILTLIDDEFLMQLVKHTSKIKKPDVYVSLNI